MRMSDINAERVPSPTSPASTSSAPPAPPSVCVGITGHYRWKEDWERASESLPKPFVSVTVQNPETVGKMINKYVAYEIEPVSNESGISYGANVKRRYNDFAWLREVLVSRYVGMLIPPIPSTSVVFSNVGGNHTDAKSDYVINRMSQLNSFMSELLNNPFLRCDQSFRSFVTADDAVFKVAKESAKNSNFLTDCSEGAVLWRKLLEDVTILDTIGTSLVSLGSMTDTMLKSLDDMELACAQLARKAQSLAKEMRDYSANTVLWSENEIDLADPYKNVIGNKYSKNIGVVMNGLVVGCGHWSINTSILPRMIATVLFANIQYQIKAVHGMFERRTV